MAVQMHRMPPSGVVVHPQPVAASALEREQRRHAGVAVAGHRSADGGTEKQPPPFWLVRLTGLPVDRDHHGTMPLEAQRHDGCQRACDEAQTHTLPRAHPDFVRHGGVDGHRIADATKFSSNEKNIPKKKIKSADKSRADDNIKRKPGRPPGAKNKTALVRLDKAAAAVVAQVSALKADDKLYTLGKDRLAEIEAIMMRGALAYSPAEKDEKGNPCRPYWEPAADEMRFLRFMALAQDCAKARAPYESPRLAAVQPANQQALENDDDDGIDPREKLKDIVRR